ncbi:hypothetical protein QTP88_028351 [Uroleucon formosanum]
MIETEVSASVANITELPWPTYNKYFEVTFTDSKNFMKCKFYIKSKTYSTAIRSSSNLKKHITIKHDLKLKELEEQLKSEKTFDKRKQDETDDNCKTKKQLILSESFSRPQYVSQEKLDSMITEFVVLGNHTFSIVEEEKFKYLMNMCFPKKKCLTRKTLMGRISNISQELKIELKKQLMSTELKYVCATAHCWSSTALACQRLKGRHTFDVLAKVLHSIFCEYGIINKISRVVTDNGSNFIKAFSVHTQTSETRNTGSSVQNSDDDEDGKDEIYMIEIDEILANGLEQNTKYSLPPHHRCASHTLNLMATRDSEKALSNVIYKKQIRSFRTSVIADTIHDALNVYINVPNTTRWNSTYNAVKCLSDQLQKSEAKVQRIYDESGIPRFDKNDLAFMIDYCKIMEPLSRALNILQGDKYMAMGYIIPTISWLKRKLTELSLAGKCKRLYQFTIHKYGIAYGIVNDNVQPATEDDFLFDGDNVEVEQPNTEIDRYLTTPLSGDLLILNIMPIIKNIFLKYNTALSSSASVERLFSVADDICTKKYGKISNQDFKNCLLVKINFKIKNKLNCIVVLIKLGIMIYGITLYH